MKITGLETIIFARREQPRVKIIAITGVANQLHLDNARGLGASRVIAKPFGLDEVAAAVKELMAESRASTGSVS